MTISQGLAHVAAFTTNLLFLASSKTSEGAAGSHITTPHATQHPTIMSYIPVE
jgi:hypothetical protein